jgi:hypothetical protein
MELTDKRIVEQVNKFGFTYFSLCFYFYFSTGYFCLFYKKISVLLSNGHPGRICLTSR